MPSRRRIPTHMKRTTVLTLSLMFGFLFSSGAEPLEPGADAPKIRSTTSEGVEVNLCDIYAKGPHVGIFLS